MYYKTRVKKHSLYKKLWRKEIDVHGCGVACGFTKNRKEKLMSIFKIPDVMFLKTKLTAHSTFVFKGQREVERSRNNDKTM